MSGAFRSPAGFPVRYKPNPFPDQQMSLRGCKSSRAKISSPVSSSLAQGKVSHLYTVVNKSRTYKDLSVLILKEKAMIGGFFPTAKKEKEKKDNNLYSLSDPSMHGLWLFFNAHCPPSCKRLNGADGEALL